MAKISLRAYQRQLDGLLEENRFDEVIAHARHILKARPKNLKAGQRLGAALFAAARWEEAAETLRRLLGALPLDFQAHSLLAQAYQQLEQYDKAIWHAERAADQQPNSRDINSLIRDLYRRQRGIDIDRLQPTVSAIAGQHIRSSRLQEALEALADGLEHQPRRIDLQLLQARALWLAGRRADAAETALEILTRLPYSRTANRIMTELWLSEQRPSDAQPYLERIEELDPYLAHQLVSGQPPDDSLLMIERLDDDSSVNLDWLNNLGRADDADFEGGGIDASGLEALVGMSEAAPPAAMAGGADWLPDIELAELFDEPPAAAAEAPAAEDDEAAALFSLMDERGFFDQDGDFEDGAAEGDDAQLTTAWPKPEGADDELAALLEQLDSDDSDSSWLMDIQQSAADAPDSIPPDESPTEEVSPEEEWLSAALEGMKGEQDSQFDLFADDEQLQNLLGNVNETQPIHPDDIEFWLDSSDIDRGDAPDEAADFPDMDEIEAGDLGHSWLDDEGEGGRATLDLIDDWQAELDDGEEDYDDWLSEEDGDLGEYDAAASRADAPEDDVSQTEADQTARAWGLKDAEELSDFVEEGVDLSEGEASADWLNAMVPGLDHEGETDAPPADEQPVRDASSSAKAFDWVSDIIDDETGEAPQPAGQIFSFSRPPLWLTALQKGEIAASAGSPLTASLAAADAEAATAELNFDVLDVDSGFDFDAPTEKIIPIRPDETAAELNFNALDLDDDFDLDAPTEEIDALRIEKTVDDQTAADDDQPEWLEYDGLDLDDGDFDFDDPDSKNRRRPAT